MKELFYIIIFCLGFLQVAKSQQVPLYSQYMMNGFLINPAIAGSEGYTVLNLTAREQWLGLKDAPKTHAICAQTRILKNSFINKGSGIKLHQRINSRSGKIGLGGYIFNDKNGPINRTGVQLTYAYHIRMKRSQLSFGLSGIGYQFSVNESKLRFEEEDQFWQNSPKSLFIPDANFGVYYSDANLYGGISVSQLFQSALRFGERDYAEYRMKRYYYLIGGYNFQVSEYIIIEPSFLFKTTESFVSQADITTKVLFGDDYWGGLSYRTGGALIFMGGVRVDKYYFGYAFDYTLSSIMKHSFGSHEFMFIMKLGDNARRYRWLTRF